MEDLTIYEKFDKLLKANTNLSTENLDLHEKVVELQNTIIDWVNENSERATGYEQGIDCGHEIVSADDLIEFLTPQASDNNSDRVLGEKWAEENFKLPNNSEADNERDT